MRDAARLLAAGLTVWACSLVSVSHADSPPAPPANTITDKEKSAGWQLLFDGKSLEHFRKYNGDVIGPQWKVIDGAIVLTARGGGDLVTRDQYDSFELVLEYAISKGGNSGVMFHVREGDREPGMNGPEIQILDNVDAHESQKAGWLYGLYQPAEDPKTGKPVDATKPAGQWNQLHLTVDGPKVRVELNGVKYEEFELWGDDWNQRVARSKFAQWPEFGKAKKGFIDVQDHGSVVGFRNIKIRPIKQK
jgi:hypothetical protein